MHGRVDGVAVPAVRLDPPRVERDGLRLGLDRGVDGVVGEMDEERAVPGAPHGGDGLGGEAIGEVLAFPAPRQARDVAHLGPGAPQAAIGMEEGRGGSPEGAPDVDVEPVGLRVVRRVAQVPLAHVGGEVPGEVQGFGDRQVAVGQVPDGDWGDQPPVPGRVLRSLEPDRGVQPGRVEASHDRGSGG